MCPTPGRGDSFKTMLGLAGRRVIERAASCAHENNVYYGAPFDSLHEWGRTLAAVKGHPSLGSQYERRAFAGPVKHSAPRRRLGVYEWECYVLRNGWNPGLFDSGTVAGAERLSRAARTFLFGSNLRHDLTIP